MGRQHDDRAFHPGATHDPASLPAIHIRQADIQHNRVVMVFLGGLYGFGGRFRLARIEFLMQLQLFGQRLSQRFVVVAKKYSFTAHLNSSACLSVPASQIPASPLLGTLPQLAEPEKENPATGPIWSLGFGTPLAYLSREEFGEARMTDVTAAPPPWSPMAGQSVPPQQSAAAQATASQSGSSQSGSSQAASNQAASTQAASTQAALHPGRILLCQPIRGDRLTPRRQGRGNPLRGGIAAGRRQPGSGARATRSRPSTGCRSITSARR